MTTWPGFAPCLVPVSASCHAARLLLRALIGLPVRALSLLSRIACSSMAFYEIVMEAPARFAAQPDQSVSSSRPLHNAIVDVHELAR